MSELGIDEEDFVKYCEIGLKTKAHRKIFE